jgi:hypothetical protein
MDGRQCRWLSVRPRCLFKHDEVTIRRGRYPPLLHCVATLPIEGRGYDRLNLAKRVLADHAAAVNKAIDALRFFLLAHDL